MFHIKPGRVQLETQFKDLLVEYDTEIRYRSECLQTLNEMLSTKMDTLRLWKEKRDEQEIIFNRIVVENEREETKEREEKILLFMMNRAAIIIQRMWRQTLFRRKQKKKSRTKRTKKMF